jgi:imidazole glycerol-phosphate synthase subunit HisF
MFKKQPIRIIPKLDIKNGLLIKGINLEGLRVLGDPFNFASEYYNQGADEICYLDNVATLYGTNNLSKFISKTAKDIHIPISVGGGIRTFHDIENALVNGADKICLNSKIIDSPIFLKKACRLFGSSNITAIIETTLIEGKYFITKSNGRDLINMDPITWAKKIEDLGAGEIFLTCVHKEGLKSGFDIKIVKKICNSVKLPVIAHGGAGSFSDILNIIQHSKVSGVAISGLFHYPTCVDFPIPKIITGNLEFLKRYKDENKKFNIKIIKKLKNYLRRNNIEIR